MLAAQLAAALRRRPAASLLLRAVTRARDGRAAALAAALSSRPPSFSTDAAPAPLLTPPPVDAAPAPDRAASGAAASAAPPASEAAPHVGAGGAGLYRVEIVTGDVRGAGTTAAASLRLVGEHGVSEEFVLGNDQDEYGFERGSVKQYALPVRSPIGRVRRVDVAQVAPAADEAGTGWYLDRVVVTPPGGGGGGGSPASPAPSITFPCGAWFGSNEEAVAGASAADAVVSARALVPRGAGPAPGAAATPSRPSAAPAATASLAFDCGGAAVPHPEKVAASGAKATCRAAGGWAGEDAYFVERLPGGGAALGVSDGVWMWRLHGIDAGAFSRALMRHAAAAVAAGETDPASALATAEACTLGAGVRGSATACIVTLDAAGGALAAANVGDSGFAVAGAPPYAGGGGGRHDQGQTSSSPSPAHRRVVKFRSPQQEHEFGRPYQLGHHPGADRASAAMRTALPLAPGDVIILGSDGLWDNLDDDGLLAAIAESDAAREPAAALARRLTAAAFDGSVDRKRSTPYSVAATEELGMVYSGGKADDITVVCARVRGVGR